MDYEEQLSAAKFRAERDQARQEVKELREELDAASKDAAERSKILEAARWVRDHGGLAHVMDIVHDFRAVVERIGVEWSESELHIIMDVLDSRLMPEGMEWPRFEDNGELVTDENCPDDAVGVFFALDGSCWAPLYDVPENAADMCERVKRPAVLAADNEPLEVGQTVWMTDSPTAFVVDDIMTREDGATVVHLKDGAWNLPQYLTHKRPVLDADGVPIKVGDTVWSIDGDGPLTVESVRPDDDTDKPEDIVWCGEWLYDKLANQTIAAKHRIADQLTNTKPEIDSWERIEEDAGCTATKYNERRGTIFTTKQQVARDLVRRCRALAERERGE